MLGGLPTLSVAKTRPVECLGAWEVNGPQSSGTMERLQGTRSFKGHAFLQNQGNLLAINPVPTYNISIVVIANTNSFFAQRKIMRSQLIH